VSLPICWKCKARMQAKVWYEKKVPLRGFVCFECGVNILSEEAGRVFLV